MLNGTGCLIPNPAQDSLNLGDFLAAAVPAQPPALGVGTPFMQVNVLEADEELVGTPFMRSKRTKNSRASARHQLRVAGLGDRLVAGHLGLERRAVLGQVMLEVGLRLV
jgi:hypothetical protein